jgi:hypothetical protein
LLHSSFNQRSSLAVEVEAEEVVDAVAEVVEGEAVVLVRVEGFPLRRLPHARLLLGRPLRAQPLGQAPRAPRQVLGLLAVRQPVPGRQVVLLPRRRRKAVLAPAALRQDKLLGEKALPARSAPPEQVQMSLAAVQRLARSIISSMFPIPRQVQPQQRAQDVPVALPPIFCKVVRQLSVRQQPRLIGLSLRARQ